MSKIPVVLADHHAHRRLQALQDLRAQIEFFLAAELRQVAAVEHEVGLRIEALTSSTARSSCRTKRSLVFLTYRCESEM